MSFFITCLAFEYDQATFKSTEEYFVVGTADTFSFLLERTEVIAASTCSIRALFLIH